MNRFFILLPFFFVRVRCDTVFQNRPDVLTPDNKQRAEEGDRTDILASVRQYPSLLHKCTATFIAPDALLTTAKCLYCEDCRLFVHALSNRLTDDIQNSKGVSYNINTTVIHPDFEKDPQNNDIGLIQLVAKVWKAEVFHLRPNIPELSGSAVATFRWQFTSNFREYNLKRVTEQTISNAACSSYFNQYIDHRHVCTRRNQSILLGHFDQGVPLVDNTTGRDFIVGIYQADGKTRRSKVEVYQAIFPFVAWIGQILACNFSCGFFGARETTPVPATISTSAPSTPGGGELSTEITSTVDMSPIVTAVSALNEPDEAPELEFEERAPYGATGGESRQGIGKPLAWSADFPFSEQKQAPLKPKALLGKRFT